MSEFICPVCGTNEVYQISEYEYQCANCFALYVFNEKGPEFFPTTISKEE